MDPTQELLRHCTIWENIFQYLSLYEQTVCVDICEAFSYVITKILWKKKYRILNIYKTPYISVITNTLPECEGVVDEELKRIQEYKTSLSYEKCNVFLKHIAKSVRYLRVFSEYFSFQKTLGVAFRNIQMFKNLCSLSYNQMVVTDDQLELIAKNCLKLQKLEFIECTCDELHPLIPGYNLDVRNLAKMPQLQELIVQCELTSPQPEMNCDLLYEMLSKLTLKCLIFRNIKTVDNGADTVQLENGRIVRVLNVGNISLEFWPDFKHYLKYFHNLNDLTINVTDCNTLVNSAILEILATNCRMLERLSLENCDLYVEDFGALKTLQHLSLLSCGGFTAGNLQQVLGSQHLKSFCLMHTLVLGTVDDIYVSPSLESLKVDTIYFASISESFQKSVNIMENLHTVKWLNGGISDSWIMDKCPNLRVFHIPNPYHLRPIILKMTALRELSFTSCKGFPWDYLLILIKNLSLTRLNIHTTDNIDDVLGIPQNACDVKTSVKRITIPYRIYKTAQDFWMDLMKVNPSLNLIFYGVHGELLNTNFLRGLLRFPHVRDNVKYLKICGFPIDIHDLQNSFEGTLHQLNIKTSHYRSRNAKFTIEI